MAVAVAVCAVYMHTYGHQQCAFHKLYQQKHISFRGGYYIYLK